MRVFVRAHTMLPAPVTRAESVPLARGISQYPSAHGPGQSPGTRAESVHVYAELSQLSCRRAPPGSAAGPSVLGPPGSHGPAVRLYCAQGRCPALRQHFYSFSSSVSPTRHARALSAALQQAPGPPPSPASRRRRVPPDAAGHGAAALGRQPRSTRR